MFYGKPLQGQRLGGSDVMRMSVDGWTTRYGAVQPSQNQTDAVLEIKPTAMRLRDRLGSLGKATLRTPYESIEPNLFVPP